LEQKEAVELNIDRTFSQFSPIDIQYVDCGSNARCLENRLTNDFLCTACSEELEGEPQIKAFDHLMKSKYIKFNDIPKDLIVHIETKTSRVDMNDDTCYKRVMRRVKEQESYYDDLKEDIKEGGKYDEMILEIEEQRERDSKFLERGQDIIKVLSSIIGKYEEEKEEDKSETIKRGDARTKESVRIEKKLDELDKEKARLIDQLELTAY